MHHSNDYSNKHRLFIFLGNLVLAIIVIVIYVNNRQKTNWLESVPTDLAEMKTSIIDVAKIVKRLALNDSLQAEQLSRFPSAPLSVEDMSRVSSVFNVREDPVTGGREFHTGIDYRAPRGTIVHAAASGIITEAAYDGGYGNTVRIDHKNGYITTYAHLSNMTVIPGEAVTKGDTIGNVGATGKTTGSHLHYEIAFAEKGLIKKINPAYFTQTSN